MRKTRRLAAIAAAAMMTAALALPMSMSSFAAGTGSITISNSESGNVTVANHEFAAYQIFAFDYDEAENKISSVVWGEAVKDSPTAKDAIAAAAYGTETVPANVTASMIVEKLSAREIDDDSDEANALAISLKDALKGIAATKTVTGGNIEDLGIGYYFIEDTTTSLGEGDALGKYMLKVCGENTPINLKTDAPKLVKKIWHNDTVAEPTIDNNAPEYTADAADDVGKDIKNESGWNDVGDNQIGDTIYYMTASSVPDMSDYDAYVYEIHDQMGTGLTFTGIEKIVYVPAGQDEGSEIDSSKYSLLTEEAAGEDTFVVAFSDLKDVVDGKGTIYTYYTAVLNEAALISTGANGTQGNPNRAQLVYSNNPNAHGEGEKDKDENKGRTKWDFVYDWTFVSNGNKVDEEEKPLANAVFELHDAEGNILNLVKVEDPNLEEGAKEEGREYYRLAKKGESGVTQITTNADGKFAFVGLDDTVTYTLHEASAPDGYSEAGDAGLVLTASYDKETGAKELTSLSLAMETEDGEKVTSADTTVTVKNMKKTFSLPSTGGIGTTLFYVVGGALVAGAGVTLITKKRVNDSNK